MKHRPCLCLLSAVLVLLSASFTTRAQDVRGPNAFAVVASANTFGLGIGLQYERLMADEPYGYQLQVSYYKRPGLPPLGPDREWLITATPGARWYMGSGESPLTFVIGANLVGGYGKIRKDMDHYGTMELDEYYISSILMTVGLYLQVTKHIRGSAELGLGFPPYAQASICLGYCLNNNALFGHRSRYRHRMD